MTAPSYLLDLLGVLIKSNASSVATTKKLNFVAPLSATYNAGTGEVDVESEAIEADGGDVSFDPTGTVFSSTDMQALGQEISADISLTAQSVAANPTGATAKLASLAMSAQSILARAAGNVTSLAVATNALLARAGSGDLASLAVSADSVLGRDGSGNLGSHQRGLFSRMPRIDSAVSLVAALTHVGQLQRFALVSAATYTIPPQTDVAWIANSVIHFDLFHTSTQPLTITPGAGVTITSVDNGGMVIYPGQHGYLRRTSTDSWNLVVIRNVLGLASGTGELVYTPTGITGLVNGLSPGALQGNAALADAATFTAAVASFATDGSVTKVRWFWYVGVAGTPAYAAGYYDVVYHRVSGSSFYVLAEGYASGSSAPLGWTISAEASTGGAGDYKLNMVNDTGAARKAYARPTVSHEVLS